MREVYSDQDFTRVGYFKSILDAEGIRCFIRNEHGQTISRGFAGFFQRFQWLVPRLCIVDDEDMEDALTLLLPHYRPPESSLPDWTCPACKESVPGSFDSCWKCQTPKPGVAP